eukprot:m.69932 g.69932  ORF g.69932 m.69932 type:complete len:238 (-) comp24158_c0_seq1:647-1360(-)
MSKSSAKTEMVNIDHTVVDHYYRYKMPTLCTQIQKGNTILCNIGAVAESLGCDAEYPIKFLGFELGTRVQMKPKSKTSKKKQVDVMIPGHHDLCRLEELLHKFIEKFVLCSCCRLPECNTEVQRRTKKKVAVTMRCRACGFAKDLAPSLHKLVGFIGEHPPKPKTCPMRTSTNKTPTKTTIPTIPTRLVTQPIANHGCKMGETPSASRTMMMRTLIGVATRPMKRLQAAFKIFPPAS